MGPETRHFFLYFSAPRGAVVYLSFGILQIRLPIYEGQTSSEGRTVRYIPLQEYGIQILLLKIVDFAVHFVGKIAFQTFTKQGQLQSATKFDTVAVLTPHSTTQRQQGASQFIKLICNEIPGWFCSKKQGMTKKTLLILCYFFSS